MSFNKYEAEDKIQNTINAYMHVTNVGKSNSLPEKMTAVKDYQIFNPLIYYEMLLDKE
jgi:hypothetical protein